jgi:hypothetical protein
MFPVWSSLNVEMIDTNQLGEGTNFRDPSYGCNMAHACYCLAPTGTGFATRPGSHCYCESSLLRVFIISSHCY